MNQMIYHYLERIGNLLRVEARKAHPTLQPVQLEMLHYLSLCNRFSNTPAALTEYLGLTKGTVSQSLSVLEKKGYLTKTGDDKDQRVIRLHLTAKGNELLQSAIPPALLTHALANLSTGQNEQLVESLQQLLTSMQGVNHFKPFGVCKTCQHMQRKEQGYFCQLTQLPLTQAETEKICREHRPTTVSNKDNVA